MPPKPRTVERLVGLFILLPLILVLVLVIGLARQKGWFSSWLTIRAPFPPETMVPVGAKVIFGGVEIGRVKSVSLDDQGRTIAYLFVRQSLARNVKTDSTASLVRPNFIGDPVVNISFGSHTCRRVENLGTIAMRVPAPNEPADLTPDFLRELLTNLLRLSQKTNALLDQLSQPDSPGQRIMAKTDKLLTDLVAAEEKVTALLRDEKALQQEINTRLVATLTQVLRALHEQKTAVPISHDSDLEMRLNKKLQAQVDQLIAMAEKLDKMLDTTMKTDNTVSLLLRNREFYDRTLELISDIKALASETREIMANLRKMSPDIEALVSSGRSTLERGDRLLKQLGSNPLLGTPAPAPRVAPAEEIEQRFSGYKTEHAKPQTPSAEGKK